MKLILFSAVLQIILINMADCTVSLHKPVVENPALVLTSVIKDFFVPRTSQISLISCGKQENLEKFERELLLALNSSLLYNLEDCHKLNSIQKRSFVVIFIDDDSSEVLHKQMIQNFHKFDTNGFYLVFLQATDKSNETEQKVVENMASLFIYNVDILTHDFNSFVLKTFFPFTKNACNSLKTFVINKFVNDSFESSVFYPKKMKNFFKCPLKVVTFLYAPVVMLKNPDKSDNFTLYGSDIELLKVVSKLLNFTINYDFDPEPGAWGLLKENGEATKGFLKVTTKQADMMIGMLSKMYHRTKFVSFTSTIMFTPIVLLIPPGAPFNAFEKLFSPFEDDVWIYLLIVFIAGLAFVTVLTVKSDNVMKNIVIGENITMPAMSIIIAVVGGSQHVLPVKSVARILLMTLYVCKSDLVVSQLSNF